MKASPKSPSYLVRNPYSYCFRMVVPKDLQKFVGKRELRYTLRTGYAGMGPSSANRPFGTHPPCGRSTLIAKSNAALSAPVWPPETILFIIVAFSPCIQLVHVSICQRTHHN